MQAAENGFGDGVVAAFAVPHAGPVAAADMQAGHSAALDTSDHRVVGFDGAAQVPQRILATRAHAIERHGVHITGVARLIDLDVGAALRNELLHHAALDGDDIGEEFRRRSVMRRRA